MKENHWIAVQNQLPEEDMPVLIYCKSGLIDRTWYSNKSFINCINVTHWMPLPAPPSSDDVMQDGKEGEYMGEGLEPCTVCGHSMLSTYKCCMNCYANNRPPVDDEKPEPGDYYTNGCVDVPSGIQPRSNPSQDLDTHSSNLL